MQGVIVKGIAGFYYVWAEDGNMYECKARGRFRKAGQTPLPGDLVMLSRDENSEASDSSMLAGTVDKLLPRENEFDRPPIANVQTLAVVVAAKDPEPLPYIIDRMIISAELKNAEVIICINKSDLKDAEEIKDIYTGLYPVYLISTRSGEGIEDFKAALSGKRVALAGPSGVGKSSLTNVLLGKDPEEGISEVGSISEKTLRGKNTTRHSELFKTEDFFVFDTPGFTSFETPELDEHSLAEYFPDFAPYLGKCRFDNCVHLNEPDCAVKAALEEGKIKKSRYESYAAMYKELKERRKF